MNSTSSGPPMAAHGHGPTMVTPFIAVNSVTHSLAIIAVILRFWVRARRGGLWYDDWLILLALAAQIVSVTTMGATIPNGFLTHVYTIKNPPHNLPMILRGQFLSRTFYFTSIGCTKISILLFCLRLTNDLFTPVAIASAYVLSSTMSIIFACIFQCVPIRANWIKNLPGSKCVDASKFYVASAALNIFSDLVVYLLPIPTVWRIKRPLKVKLQMVVLFAIGALVVIMAVMRLVAVVKYLPKIAKDPSWYIYYPSLWSASEGTIGIIVASLPAIKLLWTSASGAREPTPIPNSFPGNRKPPVKPNNVWGFFSSLSTSNTKDSDLKTDATVKTRDTGAASPAKTSEEHLAAAAPSSIASRTNESSETNQPVDLEMNYITSNEISGSGCANCGNKNSTHGADADRRNDSWKPRYGHNKCACHEVRIHSPAPDKKRPGMTGLGRRQSSIVGNDDESTKSVNGEAGRRESSATLDVTVTRTISVVGRPSERV